MYLYTFTGCVLLLIQLPPGWTAGHLLKTIGFALCMAGLKELAEHSLTFYRETDDPPVCESGLGGIAVWRTARDILVYPREGLAEAEFAALEMLRKNAVLGVAAGIVCAGVTAVFEYIVKNAAAGNIPAIVTGTVQTLLALRLVFGVIAYLEYNDRSARAEQVKYKKLIITDNFTDTLRLKDRFDKTALCIVINLLCDILNRLVTSETVQTYSGFMAVISKLTAYLLVIVTAVRFRDVKRGADRRGGD